MASSPEPPSRESPPEPEPTRTTSEMKQPDGDRARQPQPAYLPHQHQQPQQFPPGYGYPMYPAPPGYAPPGYYGGPLPPYGRGPPGFGAPFKPESGPYPPPQVQRMTATPPPVAPKSGEAGSTKASMDAKSLDSYEAERMRAQKEAEERLSKVDPIQSDFHFFVQDRIKDMRIEAEEEVRKSCNKNPDENLDPYLVNTNLNHRLAKAWETLSDEDYKKYAEREEGDQRRFMEEDEVANRHCATLTSRQASASPSPTKKQNAALSPEKRQDAVERPSQESSARNEAVLDVETATKNTTVEDETSPEKRNNEGSSTDEESPSKKTKVEGEDSPEKETGDSEGK